MRKQPEVDDPADRPDVAAIVNGIGPRLRMLRERRQLTLKVVAEQIGTSLSTLSRLEAGERAPSFELLLPLASLYGVALDDIVRAPQTGDPRVRPRTRRHGGMIFIELTSGTGPVQAVKMVVPPRSTSPPPPQSHPGYEWLYVLTGRLDLRLGDSHTILGPGEAAEFDTREAHSLGSADDEIVEVLALFSPDGERVHLGRGAD